MEWHIFSEGQRRETAPAFRLPAANGEWVALDDFRQRENLVLIFTHGTDCPDCGHALQGFAQRRAAYRGESAEIVAIVPDPPEALRPLAEAIGANFPLLSDAQGTVRNAYRALVTEQRSDDGTLLFVLDRFGAPYVATLTDHADDPQLHTETLDWLYYIEIQCPE